jgi:hypothetical protein
MVWGVLVDLITVKISQLLSRADYCNVWGQNILSFLESFLKVFIFVWCVMVVGVRGG